MTSLCSIWRTVQRTASLDCGGLPLRKAINWSPSFLCTPAIHYIVSWPPWWLIWSNSHPIIWCFLILLCPVLHSDMKCLPWIILSEATIAGLQWTNWCLHCCGASARGEFNAAPVVQLDSDSITLVWCVCGAMTCCCGNGENDEN
jgi:hypothetical protein